MYFLQDLYNLITVKLFSVELVALYLCVTRDMKASNSADKSSKMSAGGHLLLLLVVTLASGKTKSKWADWEEVCGQGSFYLFSEDLQSW